MVTNLNRVIGRLFLCIALFASITACQQQALQPSEVTDPNPVLTDVTKITDTVSIPIGEVKPNVLEALAVARADNPAVTEAAATTALNLLANPSFESGANGWVACDASSVLTSSTDSVSGLALGLSGGCVYQDVIVQPDKLYTLSCKAKLSNTTGWTGMGFGVLDGAFAELAQAPENQITGTAWTEYTTSFTTPANSGYAAIWFYTDGAVVIDDCSFSTETVAAPDPDPTTLLPNGSFDNQSSWTNCGNAANYAIAGGNLNITTNACIYQTIQAEVGADYRLSCSSKVAANTYSSITLSMLNANWAAISSDTKAVTSSTFKTIDFAKVAPAGTKYVAVTFYGEGVTSHENCFLTINTMADPVSLPDGSLFPYPSSHPTDNEAAQVANNMLINPSFANQTGWTNCAPTSGTIAGGKFTATPGVCFFQEKPAVVGKTYTLTCKGSMDLPLYSVITLDILDATYQSLDRKVQPINTGSRQWRLSITAPVDAKFVTVGFYTETEAIYDYCYLTDATPAPSADEKIYAPVKPLEIMVPVYIDPAQDLAPWNTVLSTAQKVPTTVVVNPVIGGIEGCQEATFANMLGQLQTNKVDTVGYIPTGYTATPAATVKQRIDTFKNCVGIDGVFFDEIRVSNQAEANYYQDICDYAKKAFGPGKFVVNAGTNIQIPITNEFCNVALIYEFFDESWKDFEVFGYEGANTDAATSIMIHTSNTVADMKKSVDTAYSRKIDYVYVTDLTIPNPWIQLNGYWTQFTDYLALKNTPFN